MMKLDILANAIQILKTIGNLEKNIEAIQVDSRQVKKNTLFVALKGTKMDGHEYIDTAIQNGATAIVCEILPSFPNQTITYIQVENSSIALGFLASEFYDNPSQKIKVVAITGTNGKTTTATLCYRLFKKLGYRTGLLSTVQNYIHEDVYPATLTTPNPLEMQFLLAEMVRKGCTHVFMEASSHAMVQNRIAGLRLTGAVFTNITHDHLDFHITFDNYIEAKKKLFDDLPKTAFALVNSDDKRGMVMLQNCKAKVQKTFALKNDADFKAKILENTLQGLLMEIENQQVWFKLTGKFNAYNLMTVYGIATLLEEDKEAILTELSSLEGADGRFEQMISKTGIIGIVDYAHTPDALENVLSTIQELCHGNERIITVVGCGGNRDATKRPIMAQIACKYSDEVILTSDNPRNEDPIKIIQDMQTGVSLKDESKTHIIENRKEAIQEAYRLAKSKDVILIAGKGHENYQEIKGIKHPFDDKEVLKELLNQ